MRPDPHHQDQAFGRFSKQRRPTLDRDLEILLGDICVHWGFCNRLNGADLLREDGVITAQSFAEQVLRVEAMDPAKEPDWVRRITNAFIDRYGREASSHTYALAGR